MKIVIYSGSFNPVHNGHLAVAQAALAEGNDEVWMLVSPQNPHKNEAELWPFEQRMEMVEIAIANFPRIKASDCENYLPRPSYTIHTLEFLQQSFPQHNFRLLIGGDNLLKFHLWKDYLRIVETYGLLIYPRSGMPVHELELHPNVGRINAPLLDISSSEIRKKITKNQSIANLVPPDIERYILQKLKDDRSKSVF